MTPYRENANLENRPIRTCCGCGKRITLLESQISLSLFFGETTVQQRGFQCMNCGEVTCLECRHRDCCCLCKSNAWVALPYLENPATEEYSDTL